MNKLIKEEVLLFGLPISIDGLGTIYQPTLLDFFKNDIDIQEFMGIINAKIELLVKDKKFKNFDLFCLQMPNQMPSKKKSELLVDKLIKCLKLLYKTDNIKFILNKDIISSYISIEINENEKYFINRDNYDKLTEIVLVTLSMKENLEQTEELKEELNEIDLKIAQRRKEFEKKKAKQNENNNKSKITIFDLINYIIHTNNSQFDYKSILNLTVYQVKNTFNLYRMKENYELYMDYKTSGNFKVEENIDHWYFKK